MKRLVSVCMITFLMFACLCGCAAQQPQEPLQPVFAPVPDLNWVIEPSFTYRDLGVIRHYDRMDRPEFSGYVVFRQGDCWGLLNSDLQIVLPAVSTSPPWFCHLGQLHIDLANGKSLPDLRGTSLVLDADNHALYMFQYVYDTYRNNAGILYDNQNGWSYSTLTSFDPIAIYHSLLMETEAPIPVAIAEIQRPKGGLKYGYTAEFTNQFGYVDARGYLMDDDIEFDYADVFRSGVAAVRSGDRWGYINTELAPVTDYIYLPCDTQPRNGILEPQPAEYAYRFVDGYAVVRTETGYGVINTSGEEVLPCTYQKAVPLPGGRVALKVNSLWGVADLNYS